MCIDDGGAPIEAGADGVVNHVLHRVRGRKKSRKLTAQHFEICRSKSKRKQAHVMHSEYSLLN